MKYVIIGGVAAGAGAAARLRRLDEKAQIILLERGNFISFANCGLPYHVGSVIPERDSLLVMPPKKFCAWFNADVRTGSNVLKIDRTKKTVLIHDAAKNKDYEESYDKLLIATGSRPAQLPVPGGDLPRIQSLWNIPDMDRIIAGIQKNEKHILIIGGGFIGLETAENLREKGLQVTLIQHSNHLLPTLDAEMAVPLQNEVRKLGVKVLYNTNVKSFREEGDRIIAELDKGEALTVDRVITSVGVCPNSELAVQAGLKTGKRGHICVNESLQTSDPDIYAAGDVIEVIDPITGAPTAIPLAGPANKQGRIVAGNMSGKVPGGYKGTYGASVIKIGNITAASVGLTEKKLKAAGITGYKRIYTHPASHAGYYPGGCQLHLKLIFTDDGTILGAQIIGSNGVDKRIDTIAAAMQTGLKAPDLADLEFAYAPPFNSAKDPVNFLGMIAQDVLSGLTDQVQPDTIPEGAFLLDVREPGEVLRGTVPGIVSIPLGQLRSRLKELDPQREIITMCQVGLRGYLAERILKQNGFKARNLTGGYVTWRMFQAAKNPEKAGQ